jgi:hypothetical protein
VKLSADFEKPFQEYQAMIDRGHEPRRSLAIAIFGEDTYVHTIKLRGYNGDVDMLREPKIAVRRALQWGIPTSKHAHALRAQGLDEVSRAMEEEYQHVIGAALKRYGDGDGRIISGIIRDHFPDDVKNRLRFLAHGLPMVKDAVHLHRYLAKTRSPLFK